MISLSDQESLILEISSHLSRFHKKKNGLYLFRCPICNDSQKSKFKTRGTFYKKNQGYNFGCFNCESSMSLIRFVKLYFPDVFSRYQFSLFQQQTHKEKEISEKKKKITILSTEFPFLIPYTLSPKAVAYVKSRKIPENKMSGVLFCEDLNLLLDKLSALGYEPLPVVSPRLIFPVKNTNNVLVGFVARALDPRDPIRYYNIKLTDDEPLLYGQNTINHSRRVIITEGIIDSLFLDNSLAACSAGFGAAIKFCQEHHLEYALLFDNERRNEQIRNSMLKHINNGSSIVLFTSWSYQGKDLNEMVLKNPNLNLLQEEIENRIRSGLLAKLEFSRWISL